MRHRLPAARRTFLAGYAAVAYPSFVLVSVWAIGFLADVGAAPTRIDGAPPRSVWTALLVDVGLLLLFAVQHSVMARDAIKARLPAAAARSTFVLATSLVLALLFWQWQPLPASVFRVGAQPWAAAIWLLYAAGWLIAIAATFMVDHLDFVGLRQAGWFGRGRRYQPPVFTERWWYRRVRHPMMLGLVIAFWATPRLTVGHVVFATAATAYIAVGIRFEERDLRRRLGATYTGYARRVPALVPRIAVRSGASGRR